MKCEKIAVATENLNIDDIKETSRGQLLDSWKKTYRTDAPKGISRRLMEHAAAYSIQSKIHGQLPRSIQLKLKRFQNNSHNNKVSSDLPEGTVLMREWHGDNYRVVVLRNGYEWNNTHFKSLSEIARSITGTRWSGPRFFGLRRSG